MFCCQDNRSKKQGNEWKQFAALWDSQRYNNITHFLEKKTRWSIKVLILLQEKMQHMTIRKITFPITQSKVYLIVHQVSMRKHTYFNLRIQTLSPLPILSHTRGTKKLSFVIIITIVITVESLFLHYFLFQTV